MYYPAMLDLSDFQIYVVGGGSVAFQKVKELLHYNDKINVISKEINSIFEVLDKGVTYYLEPYRAELIEEATLVVAATDDQQLNREIGLVCRQKGILCNVVSAPALSSFIVPAHVRRGSLVISVSTEGKSPSLAKRIKEELALQYNESYADYVNLLGEVREQLKEEVADEEERKRRIKQLIHLEIGALKKLQKK